MKPSGYWMDVKNVKKAIDDFNLKRGVPGTMPTESALKSHGEGSLANAIYKYHGGFKSFPLKYGYKSSDRRPNGHFDKFEVLERELREWINQYGTPGVMPTAEQLKSASPPRHDLLSAIGKHGRFHAVAKRLSLSMSHNQSESGYFSRFENLAEKIYAFTDAKHLGEMMPTPGQLAKSGCSGLIKAIGKHGGFFNVARALGLTPNRRSASYWTQETVDQEVADFVQHADLCGFMPSDQDFRRANHYDLSVAVSRHGGGANAVAQRLGLAIKPTAPRRWTDELLESELLNFIRDHGTSGQMPTQDGLRKAGRGDLAGAISDHGGWTKVAKKLGLELTQVPKNHWRDIENVRKAIAAINYRRGRPRDMPTKTDLDLAGESSLCKAIDDLGGYIKVAAIFGLESSRVSLWPRSREELVLAHELRLFMDVDLEDRKVPVGRKNREVDIIVRSVNLCVEFDSFRYHKGKEQVDERKTQDLLSVGWDVLRVREIPLERIRPVDILVRKGRLKEMCSRVLLFIAQSYSLTLPELEAYLQQKDLGNLEECNVYIAEYLSTRRGTVLQEEFQESPE